MPVISIYVNESFQVDTVVLSYMVNYMLMFKLEAEFAGFNEALLGSVAQWVVRLTRNVEVVGSSPIKGP